MKIPGFTAEHSIGRSRQIYRTASGKAAPRVDAVRPSSASPGAFDSQEAPGKAHDDLDTMDLLQERDAPEDDFMDLLQE